MNLEGSLDAFSLPDIFQLLSFTKKTGALHIQRSQARGVVYFNAGAVTGASSDIARLALGRRLVGAGLVGDEALSAAVDSARSQDGTPFARALRDSGALDEGALHEHAVEQATDAIFDLLRWGEGTFAFEGDTQNPDDIGSSLTVEDVIGEARRRLEEWEALTRNVPSPDAIVSVQLGSPVDATLSGEEWRLLALVDGQRTVSDIVAITGRGEFAVVRALAALVERSLVTIRRPSEADRDSVAGLLRRQAEVARLEGRSEPAFVVPVPPTRPAEPVLSSVEPSAESSAEPEPISSPAPTPAELAASRQPVIPERSDAVSARRRPDYPDDSAAAARARRATAAGAARGTTGSVIERDPSVNKSLLLRLIAGVRGL